MVGFESSSAMAVSATSVEGAECSTGGNQTEPPSEVLPAPKKKRNLPGMPDPDAEVTALSPATLQATNRFVCEICNKGFQRDQNLQLHRRGHNLPWKLKQRNGNEIRKRVYVCPEKTCVHNDPARALGDLTGIKKHFSRKHGEKKWNCERCSKKYAVKSDWKAHMKICGTKEYRCDCGTLFSRRDSFVTHRAFCDALAHERARSQSQTLDGNSDHHHHHQTSPLEAVVLPPPPSCSPPSPPLTPSTGVLSPVLSIQSSEVPPDNATGKIRPGTETGKGTCLATTAAVAATTTTVSRGSTAGGNTNTTTTTGVFASTFAPAAVSQAWPHSSPPSYSNQLCAAAGGDRNGSTTAEHPISLSLSSSLYLTTPSLFLMSDHRRHHQYVPAPQPALSATALLQKAAQMGAKSSNTSFLHALGLATPATTAATTNHREDTGQWSHVQMKQEREASSTGSVTMGPPATTTLDFLGLGMGGRNCDDSGGFSAYFSSIGSQNHVLATGPSYRRMNSGENKGWYDSDERKAGLL